MALTVGTGPFGQRPAGTFNFELPRKKGVIYFEDSPRRIRARFAGKTIVDSRHAKLLHEQGHLPIHYFPEEEVQMDLLEATDHHSRCPFKGEASYHSVRVGEQVADNAVWHYPEPLDDAPQLAGYLAFYWSKMGEWLEEDEPIIGHARDPYHRIDVLDTSRHIKVSVQGEQLADTTRAKVLFETGLPPRWYVPREDVRSDALADTDKHTVCAYKGVASYHLVNINGDVLEDLVWTYPEPRREVEPIRDHLCFLNEAVDIEVDEEPQERPETPFSPHRRPAHA